MSRYESIKEETTMGATPLYRSTPYEFAVTAQPSQLLVTYSHHVSNSARIVPISVGPHSIQSPRIASPAFDTVISAPLQIEPL